MSVNRPDEEID